MDRTITAAISASPARVTDIIGDLATYPHWMELVTEATPDEAHPDDSGPAWLCTLQAKIGPFSRSKRLRMVRTSFSGGEALFERGEVDGREHATWTMKAAVTPDGEHAELAISLAYGGSLWSGALEAVLATVVHSAGKKLSTYAAEC